jgi:hypothetical protein
MRHDAGDDVSHGESVNDFSVKMAESLRCKASSRTEWLLAPVLCPFIAEQDLLAIVFHPRRNKSVFHNPSPQV